MREVGKSMDGCVEDWGLHKSGAHPTHNATCCPSTEAFLISFDTQACLNTFSVGALCFGNSLGLIDQSFAVVKMCTNCTVAQNHAAADLLSVHR